MHNKSLPPVITIDGLSGVGKGTIAQLLARRLGWHYLDSGVLYRVLAWITFQNKIEIHNEIILKEILRELPSKLRMHDHEGAMRVLYDTKDITLDIRAEECGKVASQLSALPMVREMLLQSQREMRAWPGLVTDGRDMGTVVFPDASLKLFFTASLEERAKRRYNQLKKKGINVSLRKVQEEMTERDSRDSMRQIAPAKPAADSVIVDTSPLSIEQVLDLVLNEIQVIL
jgi:cytidylate kinase